MSATVLAMSPFDGVLTGELGWVVELVILAVVGAVTGVINTIAGGGSFLTLGVLVAFGMPPSVANGTNRVGVVMQCTAASMTFHRRGVEPERKAFALIVPLLLGSLVGAWLATRLDDGLLRPLFGVLLLGWAAWLVYDRDALTRPAETPRPVDARAVAMAAGIGAYGGFLQAGIGFPMLALLVTWLGYEIVSANYVKVLSVAILTAVALPIFVWADQVAWPQGLALGVGTVLGGVAGARWQLDAGKWLVRWIVLLMVAATGLLMLVEAFRP